MKLHLQGLYCSHPQGNGHQPFMADTGNWAGRVGHQKVPGHVVTVGSDGEGSMGNPMADPLLFTDATKNS